MTVSIPSISGNVNGPGTIYLNYSAFATLPNTGAPVRIVSGFYSPLNPMPYIAVADTTNEVVYNITVATCLSITQLTGS
jgi:hypothetical protein